MRNTARHSPPLWKLPVAKSLDVRSLILSVNYLALTSIEVQRGLASTLHRNSKYLKRRSALVSFGTETYPPLRGTQTQRDRFTSSFLRGFPLPLQSAQTHRP
ncbi:MAG TPA: hypothetical protein V6C90_04735 [Coleofasciculaceae cyanobacterium]